MKAFGYDAPENLSGYDEKCWIWGTPAKKKENDKENKVIFDSPRAGGRYSVSMGQACVQGSFKAVPEDSDGKVALTTLLVEKRRNGEVCPFIDGEVLQEIKKVRPFSVNERMIRLLEYLGERTGYLGEGVMVFVLHAPQLNKHCYLDIEQAVTGSRKHEEVRFMIDHLIDKGYVSGHERSVRGRKDILTVLAKGYDQLHQMKTKVTGEECFVAMSFDNEWKGVYKEAIEPAIRECGYRPNRIDQTPHNEKIDDKIVAAIKQAKFVVADVSVPYELSPNANVYYECGLAHGRGLEVIFTCFEEGSGSESRLPFDTRQYNCIFWSEHEKLKKKLKVRILATVERGPLPEE